MKPKICGIHLPQVLLAADVVIYALEVEARVSTYTQSEVSHVVHPLFFWSHAANLAYITLTVKKLHETQDFLDVSTKKSALAPPLRHHVVNDLDVVPPHCQS